MPIPLAVLLALALASSAGGAFAGSPTPTLSETNASRARQGLLPRRGAASRGARRGGLAASAVVEPVSFPAGDPAQGPMIIEIPASEAAPAAPAPQVAPEAVSGGAPAATGTPASSAPAPASAGSGAATAPPSGPAAASSAAAAPTSSSAPAAAPGSTAAPGAAAASSPAPATAPASGATPAPGSAPVAASATAAASAPVATSADGSTVQVIADAFGAIEIRRDRTGRLLSARALGANVVGENVAPASPHSERAIDAEGRVVLRTLDGAGHEVASEVVGDVADLPVRSSERAGDGNIVQRVDLDGREVVVQRDPMGRFISAQPRGQ